MGSCRNFFEEEKKKKVSRSKRETRHRVQAVVFLSVLLFKGTMTLMALPYAALGFRAGAQHCTVPKNWSCRDGPDRA